MFHLQLFHLQLLGVEGDSLIKHSGLTSMKDLVETINAKLSGWVSYFRVGNSNRSFSEIRDYAEMKISNSSYAKKAKEEDKHWLERGGVANTSMEFLDFIGIGNSIPLRHQKPIVKAAINQEDP